VCTRVLAITDGQRRTRWNRRTTTLVGEEFGGKSTGVSLTATV
jgi:hypothetical protein